MIEKNKVGYSFECEYGARSIATTTVTASAATPMFLMLFVSKSRGIVPSSYPSCVSYPFYVSPLQNANMPHDQTRNVVSDESLHVPCSYPKSAFHLEFTYFMFIFSMIAVG
jgi:hypothetical protein